MNEQTRALIEDKLTSARMLEPIKISDTVHSWLNMLNRIIDVCNIVEHPAVAPNDPTYSNVFGFMESTDKKYLDGVKWGVFPDYDTQEVDMDVREIDARNVVMKAVHTTSDASIPTSTGEVKVTKDSPDVQCVDARSDVLITLAANPDPAWFAQKLISVKALQEMHVSYAGNDFSFVNNSIYPNVEWSDIGSPKSTLLLAGTFIVYRATFIHARVLLEIVENTQIIDNYKAASAKFADTSLNGQLVFDANASALSSATQMINEDPYSGRTLFFNQDGVVGTEYVARRCMAAMEIEAVKAEDAKWSSVSLACRAKGASGLLDAESVQLEDGRHIVQIWSRDRSMVSKIDYALNRSANIMSILGVSTISMNTGRVYDE